MKKVLLILMCLISIQIFANNPDIYFSQTYCTGNGSNFYINWGSWKHDNPACIKINLEDEIITLAWVNTEESFKIVDIEDVSDDILIFDAISEKGDIVKIKLRVYYNRYNKKHKQIYFIYKNCGVIFEI